jgi:hypothetical protein
MKRLIGFLVLGGAVAVLITRRILARRVPPSVEEPALAPNGIDFDAEAKARAHAALRERLARIPMPAKITH